MACTPLVETDAGSCGPGQGPAAPRVDTAAGMPLYTFDCRRHDGSPVCLEMHELSSDERALVMARKLLDEHRSCSKIEVHEGERPVGVVGRSPD